MTFPLLATSAIAADISPLLLLPFALLLVLIATGPLSPPRAKHWWEHNYPFVSLGLGALVAGFYALKVPGGGALLGHTVHEYVSFIALIGSLFVVAGGIHLTVKGDATPFDNVIFLLIGAVLANVIGTTGASMVLVRPFIRMNKVRISAYHIVFFIFLVSNIGGALTPIGDPPLFLGYLRGIPFFWLTEHVILEWFVAVGALLTVFYFFDRASFLHTSAQVQREIAAPDTWRFEGGVNVPLLLVIIGAVFLPERFFLREVTMLAAGVASYFLTKKEVHDKNEFTFAPIKEVAWLFIGIFVTMMPALNYLEQHGREFGLTKPVHYYFATGGLSAVLDNAPTYVNFLKLAEVTSAAGLPADPTLAAGDERAAVRALLENQPQLVIAISLGAVFFGAMTYIGNGPNFMVKSIAESAGVRVPTFFGYLLKYSLPILLPILAAMAFFI